MSSHDQNHDWDSFDELLTWACWYLMESITRGEPLRRSMHHLLDVARRAKFKPRPTGHKESA